MTTLSPIFLQLNSNGTRGTVPALAVNTWEREGYTLFLEYATHPLVIWYSDARRAPGDARAIPIVLYELCGTRDKLSVMDECASVIIGCLGIPEKPNKQTACLITKKEELAITLRFDNLSADPDDTETKFECLRRGRDLPVKLDEMTLGALPFDKTLIGQPAATDSMDVDSVGEPHAEDASTGSDDKGVPPGTPCFWHEGTKKEPINPCPNEALYRGRKDNKGKRIFFCDGHRCVHHPNDEHKNVQNGGDKCAYCTASERKEKKEKAAKERAEREKILAERKRKREEAIAAEDEPAAKKTKTEVVVIN